MLKLTSYLCYLFAVLDFALYYLCDFDITGISWSPYVAIVLGAVIGHIANDRQKTDEIDKE